MITTQRPREPTEFRAIDVANAASSPDDFGLWLDEHTSRSKLDAKPPIQLPPSSHDTYLPTPRPSPTPQDVASPPTLKSSEPPKKNAAKTTRSWDTSNTRCQRRGTSKTSQKDVPGGRIIRHNWKVSKSATAAVKRKRASNVPEVRADVLVARDTSIAPSSSAPSQCTSPNISRPTHRASAAPTAPPPPAIHHHCAEALAYYRMPITSPSRNSSHSSSRSPSRHLQAQILPNGDLVLDSIIDAVSPVAKMDLPDSPCEGVESGNGNERPYVLRQHLSLEAFVGVGIW